MFHEVTFTITRCILDSLQNRGLAVECHVLNISSTAHVCKSGLLSQTRIFIIDKKSHIMYAVTLNQIN